MADQISWSFCEVWNKSLEEREEKVLIPRENIWASELGGAFIDRYLKMTAVKPSNPINPRSLRKFEAGNLMEWVVGLVLKRAGILIENQRWVSFNYPSLLQVTGKFDYLAGGNPNWDKAWLDLEKMELPLFFQRGAGAIIDHLSRNYKDGLREIIMEIKSCSSYMFEKYENTGINQNHALQSFHYLKASRMDEAHVVYISKDDLRILEFPIFNPSGIEEDYKEDITRMTSFIGDKKEPLKEKEILFDEELFKFSKNWKVSYSPYLTRLYNYKDQFEYDTKWDKIVAQFNRTFGRCVQGKNMTKLNLEVIGEIKKMFPDFDSCVDLAKEKHIEIKEDEEDE